MNEVEERTIRFVFCTPFALSLSLTLLLMETQTDQLSLESSGLTSEQRKKIDRVLFKLFPVVGTQPIDKVSCMRLSEKLQAITPRYSFIGLRSMLALQLYNVASKLPLGSSGKTFMMRLEDSTNNQSRPSIIQDPLSIIQASRRQ